MRPSPTTPTTLSVSSTPVYFDRFHSPALSAELAGAMLRAHASSKPTACSAALTMLDCGALTTSTPAFVAASTSTLSKPIPARATTRNLVAAANASASIFVALRTITASASASAGSKAARSAPAPCRTSTSPPRAAIPAGESSSAIRTTGLLTGRVYGGSVVVDPRHERPQPRTDLLDGVFLALRGVFRELRPAGVVFRDPLARKGTVTDLGEDALHLRLGRVRDDSWPAGVVAVLSGVGDRPAHLRQTAFVHQVDDELQLVQALEVRDLRLV